ncbi:MAG TPA: NAD(P)-dependent alcohol dehydrogenase [Bryobacteraceae bacterium]|jgi:NADPH:quinone reductase-like Zn-dependent oxidoreductase
MRAAVHRQYGPPEVVHVEDVPKPTPKPDEALVRVHAATVSAADWRLRKADPFFVRLIMGLRRPKKNNILGMDFAGIVEAVGSSVTNFRPGDAIFGGTGMSLGGHAEYACVRTDLAVGLKPENITMEQASAVFFGGITAINFLKRGKIQAGQRVLVYGASGSVGTWTVQLAKHYGAHVTAVCSTANLELVKSLGADEVVDYTKQDFSSAGRIYDMVLDTVGRTGFRRTLRCLKRGGAYVVTGGSATIPSILGSILGSLCLSLTKTARPVAGVAKPSVEDFALITELLASGQLHPVIERCYSLDEIAEAHRHAESGRKKGQIVIVIAKP